MVVPPLWPPGCQMPSWTLKYTDLGAAATQLHTGRKVMQSQKLALFTEVKR